MTFSIRRITRAFVARRSRIRISARMWRELISDLGERGAGVRESGAFLLAASGTDTRTVRSLLFFDDLDPGSLAGNISLTAAAFGKLWATCSQDRLRVVADVHTHPGPYVAQSGIDQANPLVAVAGHVAIVIPNFAERPVNPRDCGVHIYLGDHQWRAAYGRAAARLLYVGHLP